MKMNRRDFLENTAKGLLSYRLAAGLTAASPFSLLAGRALAEESKDLNFLIIRIHGAMDSLEGLNPWVLDNPYDSADLSLDVRKEAKWNPAADLLRPTSNSNFVLGPAAAPLAPFADKMAIVRGIYMGPNDFGHPYAMNFISSGWSQEAAPHWPAMLGARRHARSGFVMSNVSVQRGSVGDFRILGIPQVLQKVKLGNDDGYSNGSSVVKPWNGSLMNSYKQKGPHLEAMNELLNGSQGKAFIAGVTSTDLSTLANEEKVVVAAFQTGVSKVAQIDILDSGLDTHILHVQQHLPAQLARWTRVANLLGKLRDLNLLDKTLVAVVSEFTRTPGLNANGGKDHNYTSNSMALFGANIQGGSAIGDHVVVPRSAGFPEAYLAGRYIEIGTKHKVGSGQIFDVPVSEVAAVRKGKKIKLPENVDLIRPHDVWKTAIAALNPEYAAEHAPSDGRILPGLVKGF